MKRKNKLTEAVFNQIEQKILEIIDILNFYHVRNADCMKLAAMAAILMTQPPKSVRKEYLDEMHRLMGEVFRQLDTMPDSHEHSNDN